MDDWFCGDVGYVLQAGLMSGTSRTQFSPDRTTVSYTHLMEVTVRGYELSLRKADTEMIEVE